MSTSHDHVVRLIQDGPPASRLAENGKAGAPDVDPGDSGLLDAYSRAVIAVVDAVGPSVVSISVGRRDGQGRLEPQGAGSGVVIAPDGYILTNSHVVSGHKDISVAFMDGGAQSAALVGDDPATDLAVIRVNSSGLAYAGLGDSSRLRVGQLIIAMGNPFGFQSTVSTGVVSALGRAIRAQNGRLIESIVQHTAPLNPGNSGGPLLDSRGKIMGINTAIIPMAQGIGFAIPSKTVQYVVSQLLTQGGVRRIYLGIAGQTRQLGRRFVRFHNLASDYAVEIVSADPDGPARKSGMHSGDFIVAIDGLAVATIDDIYHHLSERDIDRPLTVTVIRRTERLELTVRLGEA
jgi:S1-C subfamily serine protease